MIKQKSYLLLENLDHIKKSKYWFCVCSVISDLYLFQLIVLLKPESNCFNSLNYLELIMLRLEHKVFLSVL